MALHSARHPDETTPALAAAAGNPSAAAFEFPRVTRVFHSLRETRGEGRTQTVREGIKIGRVRGTRYLVQDQGIISGQRRLALLKEVFAMVSNNVPL